MRGGIESLPLRRVVLFGIVGTITLCALLCHWLVFPTYDKLQLLKKQVANQATEYREFRRNVAVKREVAAQIEQISAHVYQSGSNEVALSGFLQSLEKLSRRRSVTLVNAKPEPPEVHLTHAVYKCKLSVSGLLSDIFRFVYDMTHREMITGLEMFTIRGVHTGREVECLLSVWMVTLLPDAGVHARLPSDQTQANPDVRQDG